MKTKSKMRPLIIFLSISALIGTGLTLYGGNTIDYLRDRRGKKTLPMADISGRLKNSFAYLVACGGVKVILSKGKLNQRPPAELGV